MCTDPDSVPAIQKDGSIKWFKTGFGKMKTPEPTGLHMVDSPSEKLRRIFSKKWREFVDGDINGPTDLDQVWRDYLRNLGVEYIWKFSDWSDPVDHLIEYLSSSPWDGYVIRDPSHNSQFICVPRDMGDKILVLGGMP